MSYFKLVVNALVERFMVETKHPGLFLSYCRRQYIVFGNGRSILHLELRPTHTTIGFLFRTKIEVMLKP
jgi:hypothetical protein